MKKKAYEAIFISFNLRKELFNVNQVKMMESKEPCFFSENCQLNLFSCINSPISNKYFNN